VTVLAADWDAPDGVQAFTTVCTGGSSSGPYSSLNLGVHVGDDPRSVARNRELVTSSQGWTNEPSGSTKCTARQSPGPHLAPGPHRPPGPTAP